jgi:hypothetical protein
MVKAVRLANPFPRHTQSGDVLAAVLEKLQTIELLVGATVEDNVAAVAFADVCDNLAGEYYIYSA